MTDSLLFVALVAFAVLAVYALGKAVGRHEQRLLWEDHMELGNRYKWAVDDLDRWCSHMSPHAQLIAHHLKAHGEGYGINAGTPVGTEACTVSGLRTQLERLKGGQHEDA